MTDLRALHKLFALKQIARQSPLTFDAEALQSALLQSAPPAPPPSPPSLHAAPDRACAIDRSGDSLAEPLIGELLITSLPQLRADFLRLPRAGLAPLLSQAQAQASAALRSHTLHETLRAELRVLQDGRPLDEDLGSTSPGPFTLVANFETPNQSVQQLANLQRSLRKAPAERFLLDEPQALALAQRALALRARLGSLSRFPEGDSLKVQVNVDEVMLPRRNALLLYSRRSDRNLVFEDVTRSATAGPFEPHVFSDREAGLRALIEGRFVEPAPQRAQALASRFEDPLRESLSPLLPKLRELSPAERPSFVLAQPSHLWDFLVEAPADRPLLRWALGRLSFMPQARLYFEAPRFMKALGEAQAPERARMLDAKNRLFVPLYGPNPEVEAQLSAL